MFARMHTLVPVTHSLFYGADALDETRDLIWGQGCAVIAAPRIMIERDVAFDNAGSERNRSNARAWTTIVARVPYWTREMRHVCSDHAEVDIFEGARIGACTLKHDQVTLTK